MVDMSNLGEFIKQKRTEKNISSRELARRSGVSQPYISQLENNKVINPTNDILRKLAIGLGISYNDLLKKTYLLSNNNFGELVREIRLSKRLSLKDLAEKSGLSCPYLSRIENGKRKPSANTIKKLADALDVKYLYLLNEAGLLSEEDIVDGENELLKENIRLNEENRKLREVIKNMQNFISDSFD